MRNDNTIYFIIYFSYKINDNTNILGHFFFKSRGVQTEGHSQQKTPLRTIVSEEAQECKKKDFKIFRQ